MVLLSVMGGARGEEGGETLELAKARQNVLEGDFEGPDVDVMAGVRERSQRCCLWESWVGH